VPDAESRQSQYQEKDRDRDRGRDKKIEDEDEAVLGGKADFMTDEDYELAYDSRELQME